MFILPHNARPLVLSVYFVIVILISLPISDVYWWQKSVMKAFVT